MVNLSLPYYTTTGALPTKGSTSYRGPKFTIEIEILKKCEENIGFRISDWKETQIEPISRKKCESRDYWNEKYPNENLIVSFFYNKCHVEYIKEVILVKEVQRKLLVHSSSCHQIGGQHEKNPMEKKDEKNDQKGPQIINNRIAKVKPTEEQGSSKNKGDLSLVIYICSGAGFLVLVVLVGIGVKKR